MYAHVFPSYIVLEHQRKCICRVVVTESRKLEIVMNVRENTTFVQNFEKLFRVF
jgi:hypothetical protein